MTRVALPVLNRSGSACPVAAAARADVRGAGRFGAGLADAVLRGAAAGRVVLGATAEELRGAVVLSVGATLDGVALAELLEPAAVAVRMGR
jgi:hypothetical protein